MNTLLHPQEFEQIRLAERIRTELATSTVMGVFVDRLQETYDAAAKEIATVSALDAAKIMELQVDMRLVARFHAMLEEIANIADLKKSDYEDDEMESDEPEESVYPD